MSPCYKKLIFGLLICLVTHNLKAHDTTKIKQRYRDLFEYLQLNSKHNEALHDSLVLACEEADYDFGRLRELEYQSRNKILLSDIEGAIKLGFSALDLYEKKLSHLKAYKLNIYLLISVCYRSIENLKLEGKYLNLAEKHLPYCKDTSILGSFFMEKANYLSAIKQSDSAIVCYNTAIKYATIMNHQLLIAVGLYNIAGEYYGNAQYDQAIKYLNLLEPKISDNQNNKIRSDYFTLQGSIYQQQNKFDLAIKTFKNKLKYTRDILPDDEYVTTLYNIFLSHYYNNDKDSALSYLISYTNNKDSLDHIKLNNLTLEFEGKYNTDKLEKEKALLVLKNEKEEQKSFILKLIVLLAFSLLLFLGITLFLFRKNSINKQRIIEAQLKLEQKKLSETIQWHQIEKMEAQLDGQEIERQRIANDLHDRVGSMLAALNYQMRDIFERIKSTTENVQFENKLNKAEDILNNTFIEVRRISHNLELSSFNSDVFKKSIENLASDLNIQHLINYQVFISVESPIPNNYGQTIYRVVQEALTNCLKYAKAKNFYVNIVEENKFLSILIEDDGIGFSTHKIQYGLGITNMHNRIKKVNGTLTIESQPNKGTTITGSIPLV